jgi:hypothetical protein
MFSTEREELRHAFFEAWRKYQQKMVLTAHENGLLEVILLHPEYHAMLTQPTEYLDKDFQETNPFLHMSLHLAIRDQLITHRPAGINDVFQDSLVKCGDQHAAEHQLMECLGQVLWDAHQTGKMPDEQTYLEMLIRSKDQTVR